MNMQNSEAETRARSNLFMACMAAGLVLMLLSLWIFTLLSDGAAALGLVLPGWLHSLLGLAMAFLPLTLLIQLARKRLDRLYPDSPPRKVPEAWERKAENAQRPTSNDP